MKRRAAFAATLAAGLLVIAAAPALAGDIGAPLRPPFGNWQRTTGGVAQSITFAKDGTVYGSAGCNRFSGGYTYKGDTIEIGQLAVTMMFCEGAMEAEDAFLKSMADVETFTATKKALTLSSDTESLKFKKAAS